MPAAVGGVKADGAVKGKMRTVGNWVSKAEAGGCNGVKVSVEYGLGCGNKAENVGFWDGIRPYVIVEERKTYVCGCDLAQSALVSSSWGVLWA
jgi:hypothetical protein